MWFEAKTVDVNERDEVFQESAAWLVVVSLLVLTTFPKYGIISEIYSRLQFTTKIKERAIPNSLFQTGTFFSNTKDVTSLQYAKPANQFLWYTTTTLFYTQPSFNHMKVR